MSGYLVDNDSPDDTVAKAGAAGAILARSYHTDYDDETLRLRHMNDVVREVSDNEPDEHLWWLFMEGDEFPHGPAGMTILDFLKGLDRQIRVWCSVFQSLSQCQAALSTGSPSTGLSTPL